MSTSATIFAVIVAVSNAIVAIFGYLMAIHSSRNDKDAQKKGQQDAAEDKLKDVCDNGSISDLIDATKKLGETRQ